MMSLFLCDLLQPSSLGTGDMRARVSRPMGACYCPLARLCSVVWVMMDVCDCANPAGWFENGSKRHSRVQELMMLNRTENTLWMSVRNRPVPWTLFITTILAAIIISFRG